MKENIRTGLVCARDKPLLFKSPKGMCLIIPMLFLVAGCGAAFEFTEPAGHPARADISIAEYHRSDTLLNVSPVETQPARSTEWDEEEEMDHHDHHHSN